MLKIFMFLLDFHIYYADGSVKQN